MNNKELKLILFLCMDDIVIASQCESQIKEIGEQYASRKSIALRNQANFLCEAFSVTSNCCYEELLFVSKQIA
jgi:hypothetical protein